MTIKFGKELVKMENYQNALKEWKGAVASKKPIEEQNALYDKANAVLADEIVKLAEKSAEEKAEALFNAGRVDKTMTATEYKFFNAVNTDVKWKEEELLPQETIDEIFTDLTSEHPLLAELEVKYAGISMQVITSDPEGAAVWGKIFGDIKGQLDATFKEEEAIQRKLTAFVVLPNDILSYGPVWVKRYVVTQIKEAFAVALEDGFLNGDGKDQPVGLIRQVQEGVTVTGGVYPEKASSGKITLKDDKTAIKEIAKIMKYHSIAENEKPVAVRGRVVLVLSPQDIWDFEAGFTSRNAMGDFITKLPFNLRFVESIFQAPGKATSFIRGRYLARTAGELLIKEFDQTLAIEDCTLYTAKQFAYGKAYDNKVAASWTLALADTVTVPDDTKK